MTDIEQYFKNSKDLSKSELIAARITAKELMEIYFDYLKSVKELEAEGTYLSNRLQFCDDINSVRWRTKDPIHLLTKIVRKRKEAIEKGSTTSEYLFIDVNNYKQVITDLVGLRAIYLFKFQWRLVDSYICNNFKVSSQEEITIYHAPEDDLTFYYQNGFEKKIGDNSFKYIQLKKDSKYRSTHYIVEANFPHNFKIEIQIRSILDEAWGEIDHYIRYPDHQDDEDLKRKMTILNGAINGCEELATNYIEYFQNKNREVAEDVFLEEDLSSKRLQEDPEFVGEKHLNEDQEFVEEALSTNNHQEDHELSGEKLLNENPQEGEELPKGTNIDESYLSFEKALNNLALRSDVTRITTAAYPSISEQLRKIMEEQNTGIISSISKMAEGSSISEQLRKKMEEKNTGIISSISKMAEGSSISEQLRKKMEEQNTGIISSITKTGSPSISEKLGKQSQEEAEADEETKSVSQQKK